jgi:tellurite resistance protein TerC
LVLVWVGVKMIVSHGLWKIPTALSLGIVIAIIATSVVASLLATRSRAIESDLGVAQEDPTRQTAERPEEARHE